jgi:hypothetical protein
MGVLRPHVAQGIAPLKVGHALCVAGLPASYPGSLLGTPLNYDYGESGQSGVDAYNMPVIGFRMPFTEFATML